MPITRSGTRITIKFQAGDSKGGVIASPFVLNDIYVKSASEGWSPAVTRQNMCYFVPYSIYIEGSTYFSIAVTTTTTQRFEEIVFTCPNPSDNYCFYSATPYLKIGDSSSGINVYGASLIADPSLPVNNRQILIDNGGLIRNTNIYGIESLYLYGTSLNSLNATNIITRECTFGTVNNEYTRLDNYQAIGPNYGIDVMDNYQYNNNIQLINNTTGILSAGDCSINMTFNNLKIINSFSLDTYVRIGSGPTKSTKNLYFVDCIIDTSKLSYYISGNVDTTGNQYLQSSFIVTITDPSGNFITDASIQLYDSSLNLVYNNLSMSSVPITYFLKTASASDGVFTNQQNISYEPFKLVVNRVGYKQEEVSKIRVIKGSPTILRPTLTTSENAFKEVIEIF